ncbi:MAG: peptidylprolyl isomerase [Bacteroidia bacterium]|nr:peptidylprolyl isomerase [Bacteroidia bacterium]
MKKLFLILLIICGTYSVFTAGCKKDKVVDQPSVSADSTFNIIEVQTSEGNMYFQLYDGTPLHRDNFLKLVNDTFLNGTTFHRVVPDFVIQGGDPNSKNSDSTDDGKGGPGYTIPAEINTNLYKHDYGAIGAARDNNPAKSSSGSQFYVVVNKSGTHFLDGNYTVFGKVVKGMDVAVAIASKPRNANDRPFKDIKMRTKKLNLTRARFKADYNIIF